MNFFITLIFQKKTLPCFIWHVGSGQNVTNYLPMHWQALPTTLSLVRCYWAGDTGGTEAGQVASGGRTPVHLLRPLPLFQGGSGRGERGKRQNKLGRCLHCLTVEHCLTMAPGRIIIISGRLGLITLLHTVI